MTKTKQTDKTNKNNLQKIRFLGNERKTVINIDHGEVSV